MKKTTLNKTMIENVKKLEYLLVYVIIFCALALFARNAAPNFINVENSFIQIKIEEAASSSFSVFIGGAVLLFVMIYNFLYHQLEKAEKGVILAIGLVVGGTIANLIDIIFLGSIINYIRIGGHFSTNLATCFMIIGWLIWIGSLLMYSNSHDLQLKKIYEAQDEELATGKSSKMDKVESKKKSKKK